MLSRAALLASLLLLLRGSFAEVAEVASSGDFLRALLDERVRTVRVVRDFALATQDWPATSSRDELLLLLERDVTIESAGARKKIDLGFRGATVAAGAGVTLQVKGLHFVRSEESEKTGAARDQLVPFFSAVGNGRLLLKGASAELGESGTPEMHVEEMSSQMQNATIVGEATCRAMGMECPLGAVLVEGKIPSLLDKFLVDEYDCLHVFVPQRSGGLDRGQEALVEDLYQLHSAVQDDACRWIFLTKDIVFGTNGWPTAQGSMDEVLTVSRNMSIITHPWLRPQASNPALLDLNFRLEKLRIVDDAHLHIKGVTFLKSVSSVDMPTDLGFFETSSGGRLFLEETVVEVLLAMDTLHHVRILRSSKTYEHLNLTQCGLIQASGVHQCKVEIHVDGGGSKLEEELKSLPGGQESPLKSIAFNSVTLLLVDKTVVTTQEDEHEEQGIQIVSSELELFEALGNNQISLIYLSQNLHLSKSVWGTRHDEIIDLDHSVTITSYPGAAMLVLDFSLMQGRIQPLDGVMVRLQRLDLGTLAIDANTPEITVPFFSLSAGGKLSIVDVLAFADVQQDLAPMPPMESGIVRIVTNDGCRQLARLDCIDNALHLLEWSSSSSSTNGAEVIGDVKVQNMLIVVHATHIDEYVHVAQGKRTAWTTAAIALGIATAILLFMLIFGTVFVSLRRSPARNRSHAENCMEPEQDSKNKDSSSATSIHVNSTDQAATMPPATSGDLY